MPPPQDFWQADQSAHWDSLQSTAANWLQRCVSFSVVLQGVPSKVGCCTIERSRKRWPTLPLMWHPLQAVQSERAQSSRSGLGTRQRLVSPSGPWQATPHSLLVTAMLRRRSQRPVPVGGLQAPHWANTQSRGTQGAVQGCMLGQSLTFICAPWHLTESEPANRKSAAEAFRLSARVRSMVPVPQPVPQPLGADHSVQVQKSVSLQWPVQLDTSLALWRSHILPQ
mmetsp:Transcript_41859/g.119446  ORF Transcript_41859/g.119446 Transcript_41859/m.119446 type:complete len:225 (+) Transcript_41859:2027-2701(+)